MPTATEPLVALDWIKMERNLGANVLNLHYRILQNHGSQPCFPQNLKHPFFIENIASPSESSLKGGLSVWGFSPAKVASQCPQVCFWDRRGQEKSEGSRLDFESCLLGCYPSPLPSRLPPSSSLMPLYSKSQVGRALGPGAKMPLDWHQQRVRWGPQLLPVPLKTARPGACGGSSFCTVRFPVLCILSGVLFLQCRVSWCGCLNAAVCCLLKAF